MPYASLRVLFCLITVVVFGALGCAGGEELAPIGECESNVDCGANETCNLATNTCEPIRTENNGSNNTSPGNIASQDTGFNPGSDAGMTSPDMDQSCGDSCASDEVCMAGECVSACPEGCPGNQMCTASGCVFPECTSAGDPCDSQMGDQGDFLCLSGEDEPGTCATTCSEPGTVDNCAQGEYCFSLNTENYAACLASDCRSTADCDAGDTCVDFGNEFGACIPPGQIAIGDSCSAGDSCVAGAFCRIVDQNADTGVCAPLCDPWAATSDCPAGQSCGYFLTWRAGLCTDDVDPVATRPFERCSSAGSACNDGIRCLPLPSENVCFQYCRPGGNDCVGILPDGTDGLCNNYAFYGNREIGLCVGACVSDGDCGTDGRCDNQICRTSCTVAADCCSDPTNCRAECVNGLCE